MDEEDGHHPGSSSVIFRYWRGHRRLFGRVNRKEYTVGFKVVVLLIVSAALAVSIEFPSWGFSHPNYYHPHMTVDDLKGHSPSYLDAAKAVSKMPRVQSGDSSDSKALAESLARSEQLFGDNHPFPNLLPSDAKFPPFELSHPDTDPVGPQTQDSTSQSTSSSSLSDFYLKK
jgi:hypothetical protein